MFGFLKERRELWLFIAAWIALALLLAVKIKFDVPEAMKDWPRLISALQSDTFEDIVGDMLVGLISAYLVYLAIELAPRVQRETKTKDTLGALLSSVIHTFSDAKFTGHTSSLRKFSPLTLQDVQKAQQVVKVGPTPAQLFSLSMVAKWSHPKFTNTLQLAVSLGVEHSITWMDITDSISRLNAYQDWADGKGVLQQVAGLLGTVVEFEITDDIQSDELYWSSLMRSEMNKFLEHSEDWLKLNHC
ncbi:hypothetical protein GQL56_24205 [Pseudomonas putida]|nr:hypothetical protein [Pseudomonas putida]